MDSESSFYTDIHSHFIYSVDDGSKSIEQTLLMLQQAADNNFRRLAATPHVNDLMNEEVSRQIFDNFYEIQKLLVEHKIPLQISLASELFFNPSMHNWIEYDWATYNNRQKYLLFELPFYDSPSGVGDFIFNCRLKGLTPILAHPERYSYLQDGPQILVNWQQQGCLMQMNAGSIIGQFGQKVGEFSRKLLKANMIQIIASDAHDHEFRSYEIVREAEDDLKEFLPEEYIQEIFRDNPRRIFEDQDTVTRDIDLKPLETVSSKVWSFLNIPISNWFGKQGNR